MAAHAIILSGGYGTRLWPASRPSRPKQFLPLLGDVSMFQETFRRMVTVTGGRPALVVAGAGHVDEIERQLEALGDADAILLVEPAARDSAPAIAAAAAWIAEHDPDGIGIMVASDHYLPDVQAFAEVAATAVQVAEQGAIVTFGVRPAGPSAAYGYIHPGAPVAPGSAVRWVQQFAEKPPPALAERYLAEGWLWNSGNFVFAAKTLLEDLDQHGPEISNAAREAVAGLPRRAGRHLLGPAFLTAPKVSIDYALMEKTRRAAVAPLDTIWSDLGAWDAVHAASEQDGKGNAAPAGVLLRETEGCLVRCSTQHTVALLGVSSVGVIVEDDAILVTGLASSQAVKQLVELASAQPGAAADNRPGADPRARLKTQAHRWDLWLRSAALPVWATVGIDRAGGAFAEVIDLDVRPLKRARRLRVQARQTYVYALAGQMGWDGPWREAVRLGLDSLRRFHRRPEGGYRTRVSADGRPADDTVTLYDQAFVLLAFGWAQRTGVELGAEDEGLALLQGVIEPRRNPAGGFREADPDRPWQSNPHMHLFEAALCWAEVGASPRWTALADELGALSLDRFIDAGTGALREFYKADWTPADGADGRVVEPGHQFEWAWLLARWGLRRSRPEAIAAAHRLFAIGAEHGLDRARGVAIQRLSDDFTPIDASARLWPQTERLKAALLLAELSDESGSAGLRAHAADAADSLWRYTEDLAPGLWRDRWQPNGRFLDEPAPASSLYHIACAVAELGTYAVQVHDSD